MILLCFRRQLWHGRKWVFVLMLAHPGKIAREGDVKAMTFEGFLVANEAELIAETKKCFDRYNDANLGGLDRPALISEAQFYLQEVGRREDSKIARRDYRMELGVIVLIGLEILLAIYGLHLGSRQANDQDALMTKQMAVLNQLNTNMQTTAQTLQTSLTTMQSMNDRLASELGRMSQITVDLSMSGTKVVISNQGNVDLQFWGFKVADMPARMNKQPVLLRRSADIELAGVASDIHKASKGDVLQVYIRDDFNNEFVAEGHQQVGPNIMGFGTRLQVVQRRWSSK